MNYFSRQGSGCCQRALSTTTKPSTILMESIFIIHVVAPRNSCTFGNCVLLFAFGADLGRHDKRYALMIHIWLESEHLHSICNLIKAFTEWLLEYIWHMSVGLEQSISISDIQNWHAHRKNLFTSSSHKGIFKENGQISNLIPFTFASRCERPAN